MDSVTLIDVIEYHRDKAQACHERADNGRYAMRRATRARAVWHDNVVKLLSDMVAADVMSTYLQNVRR